MRLCHPKVHELYYDSKTAEWVAKGWTRWSMAEWEKKFSNDVSVKVPGVRYIDPEKRVWEFFGYTIPLYDADEKT